MGIESKWLGQRQPSTGPRGTPPTVDTQAAQLQETQVIPDVIQEIPDTLLTIEADNSDRVYLSGYVTGIVTGANNDVTPLVDMSVQEFDADGTLLGSGLVPNAQAAQPPVPDGQSATVAVQGIYTPQDPLCASFTVRLRAGAISPTTGSWSLNPATGTTGGAVLSATKL